MGYRWWNREINIYTDYTNNIISKKFWFIKWLVENDKIDLMKSYIEIKIQNIEILRYESLLMLLAIQDEPIRFLCEIIK